MNHIKKLFLVALFNSQPFLALNKPSLKELVQKKTRNIIVGQKVINEQLLQAAREGNSKKITLALKKGAYINALTQEQQTPLILAVESMNNNAIKLLLKEKADINKQDIYGNSALHIALELEDFDSINLLMQYNPDMKLLNKNNKTAVEGLKELNEKLLKRKK